jgi:3-dehydroquinate dehydratase
MCDSSRDRSTTADVDVAVGGARARRSATRKKTMMKMGEEGKAARVAGGWAR